MIGGTPVYQAYLNGQLQVVYQKIAEMWMLARGADDIPPKLFAKIVEATKLLPPEMRTPDMPALPAVAEKKRQSEDDFSDLLG